MLESFNSETKELCATIQDLQTHIDIVNKELTVYPEQKTLHLENVANITIDSDSITPQKKKWER